MLVHPESPASVIEQAHIVGSTSRLIEAVQKSPNDTFIVATDKGILHKMKSIAPNKNFIEAPTAGESATCKSCAHCPWMAMNALSNLAKVLETHNNEINVPQDIAQRAHRCIDRMLTFAEQQKIKVRASGDLEKDSSLFSGIGPA